MVKVFFLEEFGKAFVPRRAIPTLRRYFLKAGMQDPPYRLFGLFFYIGLAVTLTLQLGFLNGIISQFVSQWPLVRGYEPFAQMMLAFLSVSFMMIVLSTTVTLLIYFTVDLMIFRRTQEMEEMLPDYLQVVSANLRGGMTFENALWAAITPRFKVLANEMAEVAKKVMTGYQVKRALIELSQKYDSPMLRRSVDLMVSEFESGGNIAQLLDNIVTHLKETHELKEDISASAVSYVIFISIIVIVISPLLFALAFNLLTAILGFIDNLAAAAVFSQALPFSVGETSVNPEDFKTFSYVTIMVIALFASMIVSTVEKGNIKSGLKYIPIFTIGSLLFYMFFMSILGTVFSGVT